MAPSLLTSLLVLAAAVSVVEGAELNTTNQIVEEGSRVDITCRYTLEDSEVVSYIYIDTYIRNSGFRDVATFYPNGTAFHNPYGAIMRNRTSLSYGPSSVTFTFNSVRCSDEGEYYCNLHTNETYIYRYMEIDVMGPTTPPTILLGEAAGCFHEGESIQAACVSLIASETAHFVWHALRLDNTTEEVTVLADPGLVYRPHPDTCGLKRVSHITFNATALDEGMTLRCSIFDPYADVTTPPSGDECGEMCAETTAFHMKRHPDKPTVTAVRRNFCPGDSIQVACYGDIGDHTGHFYWFTHLPGQDPVNVTSQSDYGSPYKRHNSCQYERASMVVLTADPAQNGLVVRCLMRNDEDGITPTPGGNCGHHCAETDPLTIEESCEEPPSDDGSQPQPQPDPQPKPQPKPPSQARPVSGATTLSSSLTLATVAIAMLLTSC